MPRGKSKKQPIQQEVELEIPQIELEKVECELLPITKSLFSDPKSEKRYGIYSNSVFTFPNFAISKWVVSTYLSVDYEKYYNEGWTENRLIDACINHLNYVERKKGAKKDPKPKFGKLEPLVSRWKGVYDLTYKGNRIVINLITDDPKNSNFWGEGA